VLLAGQVPKGTIKALLSPERPIGAGKAALSRKHHFNPQQFDTCIEARDAHARDRCRWTVRAGRLRPAHGNPARRGSNQGEHNWRSLKAIAPGSCALRSTLLRAAVAALLVVAAPGALADSERQSLEELRNTVINLLQALVEQGVMTREKADQLVKRAQEKAAGEAAAVAKQDEGAVRVPYVPQIVKDEIGKQVAEEVQPKVVESVLEQAKSERWGVPGAIPAWLSHVRLLGDVMLRMQTDLYARDNVPNVILDYNSINAAGGITRAGPNAFLNVTEDRYRLRVRVRFGAELELGSNWFVGARLATAASAPDPSSESITIGNGGAHYPAGFDLAYIRYEPLTVDKFAFVTAAGGRIPNPWFRPTELVYADALTLDGIAGTVRAPFGSLGPDASNVFLTLGVIPFQEVPLADTHEKWMLGAQLGVDWQSTDADRLRVAAAYYDFLHVTGVLNAPDSTLTNYTAPPFIRYGNTYFNIANSTVDPTIGLYALAAHFRLADLAASYRHTFDRYVLSANAEAVRNVGYGAEDVFLRSGIQQAARNRGYVVDFGFGDPVTARLGAWRAAIGYRYVQRDAVLDAWTDADFHEGGTNAQGYYVLGDFGLAPNTWLRVRWMSGNEIDGPRYAVDILQVDLNARF
jgi:hypothetical protein